MKKGKKSKMLADKRLLKRALLAVGLKTARSKKTTETSSWPCRTVKTVRCIRLEDARDRCAAPVHFIDKDYGDVFFKFFAGEAFFEDEDGIVKALQNAREFMWMPIDEKLPSRDNVSRWSNPFFGCKSMEEIGILLDLNGFEKKHTA